MADSSPVSLWLLFSSILRGLFFTASGSGWLLDGALGIAFSKASSDGIANAEGHPAGHVTVAVAAVFVNCPDNLRPRAHVELLKLADPVRDADRVAPFKRYTYLMPFSDMVLESVQLVLFPVPVHRLEILPTL